MRKETSIGERLHELMQERGLSYEQFGKLLDMRPQTINRYVLGQREPKLEAAMDMALRLDVNIYWLQGYDVSRTPNPEHLGEPAVPIVGTIRAGLPAIADQEIVGYAAADVRDPQNYYYLRVQGSSMSGAGIQSGDLVLVRRSETAESGQIVACAVNQEDATLKRLIREKDCIILQPENPAYEPRVLHEADFENGDARILGVAVRLVRDL